MIAAFSLRASVLARARLSRVRQAAMGSLIALAVLAQLACDSSDPLGTQVTGSHAEVMLGQEFYLRLQTIGPGEYTSPPTLSADNLRFLGVTLLRPHVPAGVTQAFHFKAVARGPVVVTLQHTEAAPLIVDTIDVQ